MVASKVVVLSLLIVGDLCKQRASETVTCAISDHRKKVTNPRKVFACDKRIVQERFDFNPAVHTTIHGYPRQEASYTSQFVKLTLVVLRKGHRCNSAVWSVQKPRGFFEKVALMGRVDQSLSSRAKVDNDTVKPLVSKMHETGLSPKTIENYVGLVRLVVKSAKENGRELFPRTWSNEEMDIPEIQGQRRPYFTAEMVSAIISHAKARDRVLYALLAGSGLRIGEALGLEVRRVSPDGLTLDIRQSIWRRGPQAPKTRSAIRKVHLCRELATLIKTFIGERTDGFLFANVNGRPRSQRNILGRSLHPILAKKLKVEKQGFHGFRRFRLTWLRKNRVPGDLERFWMGHSDEEVGDLYSKMEEEADFCLKVAESVGLGFALPEGKTDGTLEVAPIAPKITAQARIR